MAVKHIFSFDVPAEKVAAYLKWSKEKAVPYFEAWPSVISYDVYQTIAGSPTFTKEMVYKDLAAFKDAQEFAATDPEAQRTVGEFFSFVVNLESRLIVEVA